LPVVDLPLSIEEKTNLIETQETESLPIKYDEEDEPCVSTKEEHDTNCVKLSYGPCLWFFFGRNVANDTVSPMLGRPEHTDSVSHDGTWHYQLSGTKTWHLRPTEELLQHQQEASGIDDGKQHPNISVATDITCQEGDILLVNTRLWWHRTTIPSQVGIDKKNKGSGEVPSVSYARDVYLSKNAEEQEETQTDPVMTNVDGLYASANIEAGTIIFTEADMPDCELHRSKTNPNCEVVELEDGTGALVSCCDIKTGDFFCVLESDDDDSYFCESIEEEEEEEDQ
jgi:U3 small nucleolar RNA-associated protein 6